MSAEKSMEPIPYDRPYLDCEGNTRLHMSDGWIVEHDGISAWSPTKHGAAAMYDLIRNRRAARAATDDGAMGGSS